MFVNKQTNKQLLSGTITMYYNYYRVSYSWDASVQKDIKWYQHLQHNLPL